MSYILDALKKSQHERQLGKVPTIDTSQVDTEPRQGEPNRWVYSAVILALAAIIVAGYGIVDERADTPSATTYDDPAPPSPAVRNPLDAAVPPAASSMPPTPAVPDTARSASASDAIAAAMGIDTHKLEPGPVPYELFGTEAPSKSAATGPFESSEPALPLAEEDPGPSSLPTEAFDTTIPFLRQLSYEFRQTVPAMSLDVHVYRESPARRFVLINETLYREGEHTAEGPLVQEIAPDGVIFSYQGTLFRLGT